MEKTQVYSIHAPRSKMPSRYWNKNQYRDIHIVQHDKGTAVKVARDTKTQKIIKSWCKLYEGKTQQSEYFVALQEAKKEIEKLEQAA